MKTKQLVWDTPLSTLPTWHGALADEAYTVVEASSNAPGLIYLCAFDSPTNFIADAFYFIINKTPYYQVVRHGNVVMTDTDGNLCIINLPGIGLIIKNRLGTSRNVMYTYRRAF